MIQWYFVSLPSGQRGTYFCPYQRCMHEGASLVQHLGVQAWFLFPLQTASFRQVTVLEMWLGIKASGQRNWKQNNEVQSCVCLLVGFKNKIQISHLWFWLSLHISGFSTTASWVWRNYTFCIFSLSCLFNDDISACLVKEQIVSVFCRTVGEPWALPKFQEYDDFVSIEDGIK